MVKERRLFVRFLMSGIVFLQIDPKKTGMIDCQLIDLCYDGVGLYSPAKLIPGTKVKFITINRQLNVNIGGSAKVVFCKSVKYNDKDYFRAGLEFIEVDRKQVRIILKNVRETSENLR